MKDAVLKLVLIGATVLVATVQASDPWVVIPNHPQCTEPTGPWAVYFPHPTNCSKFYECRQKDAYGMECPEGLHFNSRLNVCDYPQNAQCVGGEPGVTTTVQASTSTTTGTTTTTWAPNPEPVTTTTAAPPAPTQWPGTTTTDSTSAPNPPPGTTTTTAPPAPTQWPGTTMTDSTSAPNPPPVTTTTSQPVTIPPSTPSTTPITTDPPSTPSTTPTTVVIPTTAYPPDTTPTTPYPPDTSPTTPYPPVTTPTMPYPPNTTPTPGTDPHCPAPGAPWPNYWAHDYVCSKYLACWEGCVQEFTCPFDTYWHNSLQACVYSNTHCTCPGIPPAPVLVPTTTAV